MAYYSNAQEDRTEVRDRILFGLKAGSNFSNVYDAKGEEFDAKSKLGLAAGVFLSIPIGEFIGIQPEILFSQKGFKATGGTLDNRYDLSNTTNYIDVPLLFSIKPVGFLTLLAGPQYSYLLKQKYEFKNVSTSVGQAEDYINDNNIRKNTLCFTGGVDLNIKHIVIGARAGWDLFDNNGDGTSTTPQYKNVWLQATAGYRFYYY